VTPFMSIRLRKIIPRKPVSKVTPTKVIERAPKYLETIWIKYKGKKPQDISKEKWPYEVISDMRGRDFSKKPVEIHTHNNPPSILHRVIELFSRKTQRQVSLMIPSKVDVVNMQERIKKEGITNYTSIIAVRERGKVKGYIFMRMKRGFVFPETSYTKLTELENNYDEKEAIELSKKYVEALRKSGLQLKYVPNKNRNYQFNNQTLDFDKTK
jgi:hypothetical protein